MSLRSSRYMSDKGVDFLASWEGFSSRPYNDGAHPLPGHATIGYGHLLHRGPVNAADKARFPHGLSKSEGKELLRRDLAPREKAVRDLLGFRVRRKITQQQFDALVDFTYNEGAGALAGSSLLRLLKAGHPGLAAREFEKWNKAGGSVMPGLTNRRLAEEQLFLHGNYKGNR